MSAVTGRLTPEDIAAIARIIFAVRQRRARAQAEAEDARDGDGPGDGGDDAT